MTAAPMAFMIVNTSAITNLCEGAVTTPATTVEESEDRTRQEHKRIYHVWVLSRRACERQCRILLKSLADRILARDSLAGISS
jgi:hypothetical protein